MRILFLTKSFDERAARAAEFLKLSGALVDVHAGQWHTRLPEELEFWDGDLIVSYLSRWVVPAGLLKRAERSLNFHPASPQYPGIGGVNWALYNNVDTFGVTCHQMATKVDAGPIVATRWFPVFPADDVTSLSERTWDHLLALFYDVMKPLLRGQPLPQLPTIWEGKRRTRADLDALATLTLDMSEAEMARRIRATSYRAFGPQLKINNARYALAQG